MTLCPITRTQHGEHIEGNKEFHERRGIEQAQNPAEGASSP